MDRAITSEKQIQFIDQIARAIVAGKLILPFDARRVTIEYADQAEYLRFLQAREVCEMLLEQVRQA